MGRAERDTGKGMRQVKDNGDRPPTIFVLKVALLILLQHFAKICPTRTSPCAAGCDSNGEAEILTKRD